MFTIHDCESKFFSLSHNLCCLLKLKHVNYILNHLSLYSFLQKELQNLEDACDEMLMVEDESLVPYPFFNTRMQLKWKYWIIGPKFNSMHHHETIERFFQEIRFQKFLYYLLLSLAFIPPILYFSLTQKYISDRRGFCQSRGR